MHCCFYVTHTVHILKYAISTNECIQYCIRSCKQLLLDVDLLLSHLPYSYSHCISQRTHSVSAFVGWYSDSRQHSLLQLKATADITSWNRGSLINWQSFSWTGSRNWILSKTVQTHYTLYFEIHLFIFPLSVPASAKWSHLPEDFRSPIYMSSLLREVYLFIVVLILSDTITIRTRTRTHTHIHTQTHTYKHTDTHTQTHTYTHTHIHTDTHIHTYTQTHRHTHRHKHIHTDTHT